MLRFYLEGGTGVYVWMREWGYTESSHEGSLAQDYIRSLIRRFTTLRREVRSF